MVAAIFLTHNLKLIQLDFNHWTTDFTQSFLVSIVKQESFSIDSVNEVKGIGILLKKKIIWGLKHVKEMFYPDLHWGLPEQHWDNIFYIISVAKKCKSYAFISSLIFKSKPKNRCWQKLFLIQCYISAKKTFLLFVAFNMQIIYFYVILYACI